MRLPIMPPTAYEDALAVLEPTKPDDYQPDLWIIRPISLAALGRSDEAKAWVKEALKRFPDLTAEGWANEPSYSLPERERFLKLMVLAGFPPCAKKDLISAVQEPLRLPQCTAKQRLPRHPGEVDGESRDDKSKVAFKKAFRERFQERVRFSSAAPQAWGGLPFSRLREKVPDRADEGVLLPMPEPHPHLASRLREAGVSFRPGKVGSLRRSKVGHPLPQGGKRVQISKRDASRHLSCFAEERARLSPG